MHYIALTLMFTYIVVKFHYIIKFYEF